MATAGDIIDRSLRLLGQIGSGETASSDEATDGLEALNAMLDSWRNESLMAYANEEQTLTLANADSSYTIGTSGDVNTTRPVEIEAAWIVDSNSSYPVRIIDDFEYALIPDKTTTSDWPDRLLYRPSMASSQGTIIVYPIPNATRTMKLLLRTPVTAFAATSTTVTLPPGWEKALAYNLALDLAPEFETEPSMAIVNGARESKAGIKRLNSRPIKSNSGLSELFGYSTANILTDQ